MKSSLSTVLAFMLAAGISQAATVDNLAQANYSATSLYREDPQSEPRFLNISDYRDVATHDGTTAADALVSPDDAHAALGAKFDIRQSADASFLATDVGVRWDPPGDAAVTLSNFNGNAYATSSYSDAIGRPGKIRFSVEYDLYASGEGIYAGVSFTGGTSGIDSASSGSQTDSNYTTFSEYVLGGSEPVSKQGVWTSDWLLFSSASELEDQLDALRSSFSYYATSSVFASSSTIGEFSDTGRIDGHSNVKLSYEIALMQQPVPEPETYALMIAGLLGVAWARRAGKARV